MKRHTVTRLLNRQRGLSLIELMISLVVGLILLGGLIQIYLSSKQSYNAQEQLARMQESGRLGMEFMTRDLRRAGYWGGNVDTLTIAGNPGPEDPAHTCDLGAPNDWGRMTRWRISGLNDTNAGYVDCVTGYLRGDVLTTRYASFETVDPASSPAGLFYRSTMFTGRVMTGTLAGHDDNLIPPDPAFAEQHLVPVVRQLVAHSYYVGASGRTCGADNIPSLFRVRLNASGVPIAEEIASGIEQFQVRYLLGTEYRDANELVATDWPQVSAVRIWMLVRAECREPDLQNDTTYAMGDLDAVAPYVPPDGPNFRRQLYVSTIMLRNTAVR